jgi:hypothetical protein
MITLIYDPENTIGSSVEMRVPDDNMTPDEVLSAFQRFMVAAGYLFDEGETIQYVKKKDENDYPGCGGDILTFNDNGSPYCYDFGDNSPVSFVGSGVMGAHGDDIISFS